MLTLKWILQCILPKAGVTRLAGRLARVRYIPFKNAWIRGFIWFYGVNMAEAYRHDPHDYIDFNDFFTRELKPDARTVTEVANEVASPVDGVVSAAGPVVQGMLIQAKGHCYSLVNLLGGDEVMARHFSKGHYATVYLAPKDYHCIHMPLDGRLLSMTYLPGTFYSVDATTTQRVPGLFAQNERVVCVFETEVGLMAVILVGAMIVGSMSTVWHGRVLPDGERAIHEWQYPQEDQPPVLLKKGEKCGHFELGSTVIVLFENQYLQWKSVVTPGGALKMGQAIGILH